MTRYPINRQQMTQHTRTVSVTAALCRRRISPSGFSIYRNLLELIPVGIINEWNEMEKGGYKGTIITRVSEEA